MSWLFLTLLALAYSHTVGWGDSVSNDLEKPPHWCATKPVSSRSTKRQNTCGLGSRCDDPAVRSTYVLNAQTGIQTVRIKFIMLGAASSPALTTNVNGLMDTMNKVYGPAKINFQITIDYYPAAHFDGIDATDSLAITKMKTTYANNTGSECNVFVAGSLKNNVLGFAIFPTDTYALQAGGGVVLTSSEIGAGKYTLPHEFGHALGLLHTFEGAYVDDAGKVTTPCDPCEEFAGQASDTKGDMCSDTPPTLENFKCAEPVSGDCRGNAYQTTDYTNIMGYGSNQCLLNGKFSGQQIARTRCFLERHLSGWLASSKPCTSPSECTGNVSNKCTVPDCIGGFCQTRRTQCAAASNCFENICDPADGVCKIQPKACNPPPGLTCAHSTCNVKTGACETNYSGCGDPSLFTNDPCVPKTTPFCNNATIMDCVCGTYNDDCCLKAWNIDCTYAVAHCDDVRDCIAEGLPDPVNMACETAIKIKPITYKASINDFEEFQCEGGTVNKFHGAWFYAKGTDWATLTIDTCHFETAVSSSIFIFDDCTILRCISKASSTGGCSAQASVTMAPDEDYWFYIASDTLGTIKVTINGTAPEPGSDVPLPAIIAIAVLAAVALVILLLIIYVCCTAPSGVEHP